MAKSLRIIKHVEKMIAAKVRFVKFVWRRAKLKRPKASLTCRPWALALNPMLPITHIAFDAGE